MGQREVNGSKMLAGTSLATRNLPEYGLSQEDREEFPWVMEILTEEELDFLLSDLAEEVF
jgi:hypothetical protein